jgi:hypothetical protein
MTEKLADVTSLVTGRGAGAPAAVETNGALPQTLTGGQA